MSQPLLVIAAGGTGGHMFPAQSLAEAMLAEGWRVKLSTDERGARYSGNFPDLVKREVVPSATFARGGFLAKMVVPFKILGGVLTARRAMNADRPAAVIGFGGYPAIPAMAAALLLRLPRMIHEQNGVLGRVNQLFAKRVHKVACAVWPTELPGGVRAVHTGNPVRSVVRDLAAAPYPDLKPPIKVLIFGGSQGATVLSETVPQALAALPEPLRHQLSISHQARAADHQRVVQFYSDMKIKADVEPFFEDLPDRLAGCHLVISRSGASSVADITAIGRPAILVPLAAAIRDEQTANARGMVEAGAAVLIPEAELAERLRSEIEEILSDPDRASAMAEAAKSLGRPDAVDRLKQEVISIVKTQ